MFVSEMLQKLSADGSAAPFVVTLLGRSAAAVSGIRRVLSVEKKEIKLAVRGGSVSVTGVGLMIAEIGGGDVYIKGEIAAVTAE